LLRHDAWAGGLESLETFVKTVKSGRADFTQTVTAPSREGQPGRVKTSTGTFEFQRPGQFKFDYQKPFAQTIVADGKTLWLYDADLNQVTQRAQAQALGSTPAALIAAAPDLRALQADFNAGSRRPSAMACSGSRPRPRQGRPAPSACGPRPWAR
jgi:outer membrane lipoprotein carrier protein